jgi:Tol biopolymer transport system component
MWATLVAVLLVIGAWFWLVPRFRLRSDADWRYSLRKTQLVSLKSIGGDSLRRGRFSPNGRMIVYAATGNGSNLWLAQIGGGPPFQITKEQSRDASPIWSPDGEQIAFISDRGGQPGVWIIPAFGGTPTLIKTLETEGKSAPVLKDWARSDATVFYQWESNFYGLSLTTKEIVRVTNFDAAARAPRDFRLSPDELTIAYVDSRNGQDDIWIVDRRGGAPRQVTNDPAGDLIPVWHPDGQRLLYTSERDDVARVCIAHLNGGQPEQITFEDGGCYVSDVSADGSKILYYTSKDEADLWSVDVKSGQEKQISSDIGSELWPSVAHDGAKLAYQAITGANIAPKINNALILIKSLEAGAGTTKLSADGYAPQWSPDGLKVGFLRLVEGRNELWVGSADSGQPQVVTREQVVVGGHIPFPSLLYRNRDFCWSPDSHFLAYASRKGGTINIWTITPDGANATKVSANADPDLTLTCPIWAPDGRRLVYLSESVRRKDGPPPTWQVWLVNSGQNEGIFRTTSILRLLGWGARDDQLFVAMEKFPDSKLKCDRQTNCRPPKYCQDGVCMYSPAGFTWP